jgi:hypothetical protein
MLFNAMGLTPNDTFASEDPPDQFSKLFGAVLSFKAQVQHPIQVIKANCKAEHPKSLTAYSDETLPLLIKRRGRTCTKKELAKKPWVNMEYNLRRIHRGARLGTMAAAATQNILFNLRERMEHFHCLERHPSCNFHCSVRHGEPLSGSVRPPTSSDAKWY